MGEAATIHEDTGDVTVARVPRKRLAFGRMNLVTHRQRHHWLDVPAGVSPADITETDYLLHYRSALRPLDRVTAFCEDATWEADYRVMRISDTEIIMAPISVTRHDGVENHAPADRYQVKWLSPSLLWGVEDVLTKQRIAANLSTKEAAHKFLGEHLKATKL